MNLQRTTYYDHVASNLVIDRPLLRIAGQPRTPRDFYDIRPGEFHDSPLANQLGVNIAIVTSHDNRLIYVRRSPRTFAYRQGYATAINAAMSRGTRRTPVDEDQAGRPDPIRTITREAFEELGIRLEPAKIKILALTQNLETMQPSLTGYCLLDLRADSIFKVALLRARDKFEYVGLLSMRFEPMAVAKHLTEHRADWIPQCAIAVIYTMIHTFGYEAVDMAFEGRLIAGFATTGGLHYVPTIRRAIRDFIVRSMKNGHVTGRVLDVGSGYRTSRAEVEGVDKTIAVETLDLNAALGPDIVASASDMSSVQSDTYDAVVCSELLEHVPAPHAVVNEMYRVLRPDGLLIVTVPFAVVIHERTGQPDYWRFTPRGLTHLLESRFGDVKVEIFGEREAPQGVFASARKRTGAP
jgi:SAM-dependent methyltransferase